jgi:type IV pilus biogenesis protein CpaD/CtpE
VIPHRHILPIVVLASVAGCASPSEPGSSRTAEATPHANTAESTPPAADTVGRGGNVMGGGH